MLEMLQKYQIEEKVYYENDTCMNHNRVYCGIHESKAIN